MRALLLALTLLVAPAAGRAEPYVNAFAGVGVFDSTQTVGGVKLIDQGGDALLAGLRAGYGWRYLGGLYLGAEAEGFVASGRSRAIVNGDVYSWSLRGGAGAFGRVGYGLNDGLIFARFGVMALDTNGGWETRPAVGVGAEVPFAQRWSFRIDGDYLWSGGPEVYRVTIGAVRRF